MDVRHRMLCSDHRGSTAHIAHLSRSTFSERFAAAVGIPPARYVTRWRRHLASVWLRGGRLSVSEVSASLGYESDASFSRAFKRVSGVPPGTLRQQKRISLDGRRPHIAET